MEIEKSILSLQNVTLVSITSVNVERTLKALKYSSNNILFKDVILLTDKIIKNDGVNIINIDKLDYIGYSKFIVYELYKFINTQYVLIIQDDGFVINSDCWNDEFLNYDYIGAPFPLPNDDFSYRDPFGNIIRVGNGGFSIRSKKILELPTKLNLEWRPYFGYYNEDGFFSVHNRHIFEENGCKFAPLDIASKFSFEHKTSTTPFKTFGFHGKHNKEFNLI